MVRFPLTVILLLALAAPARAADPSIEDGSARAALDQARQTWKEAGIRRYRMRVRRSCFCPREYTRAYTVRVIDGRPRHAPKAIRPYATVARQFRLIESAIRGRYSGLEVTYGATGRPTRIALDPDARAADEETTVTATRFKRLP